MGAALKKAKYGIKNIYCELYNTNIWVSYGTPKDYFIKQVKHELHTDITLQHSTNGRYIQFTKDNIAINWIWTNDKSPILLAHEAFHAAHCILQSKGLRLTDDSEEAYAYFIEFIMRKTLMP
jgi:hypothetical protein